MEGFSRHTWADTKHQQTSCYEKKGAFPELLAYKFDIDKVVRCWKLAANRWAALERPTIRSHQVQGRKNSLLLSWILLTKRVAFLRKLVSCFTNERQTSPTTSYNCDIAKVKLLKISKLLWRSQNTRLLLTQRLFHTWTRLRDLNSGLTARCRKSRKRRKLVSVHVYRYCGTIKLKLFRKTPQFDVSCNSREQTIPLSWNEYPRIPQVFLTFFNEGIMNLNILNILVIGCKSAASQASQMDRTHRFTESDYSSQWISRISRIRSEHFWSARNVSVRSVSSLGSSVLRHLRHLRQRFEEGSFTAVWGLRWSFTDHHQRQRENYGRRYGRKAEIEGKTWYRLILQILLFSIDFNQIRFDSSGGAEGNHHFLNLNGSRSRCSADSAEFSQADMATFSDPPELRPSHGHGPSVAMSALSSWLLYLP